MNQQQRTEIGERIRALRINSAETNRTIADYVGVSVDAVKGWLAGGGISYDNAEKVAELFKVDVDWLWRGDRATPDPFRGPHAEQLDRIEEKLDELLRRTAPPATNDPPGDEPLGPDRLPEGPDEGDEGTAQAS